MTTIKPRDWTRKLEVGVYMDPDLVEEIDAAVTEKNGRSAWIVEACRMRLAMETTGRQQSPEYWKLVEAEMRKTDFSPEARRWMQELVDETQRQRLERDAQAKENER